MSKETLVKLGLTTLSIAGALANNALQKARIEAIVDECLRNKKVLYELKNK